MGRRKNKSILRKGGSLLCIAVMIGLGGLICLPVLILICGSFTDRIEWRERLLPLLTDSAEYIGWRWIPDYPTCENYKELLFLSPYSCWAVTNRSAWSMGVFCIFVQGKGYFVFHIHYTNASSLSDNNAGRVFGTGWNRFAEYYVGSDFTSCFFHISGFFSL